MGKKDIILIFCVLVFIGTTIGTMSGAATEGIVTAAVTIGDIEVTLTPTSFNYGSMPFSGVRSSFAVITGDDKNIKATVGSVKTSLDIKASGTDAWTLSDTTIGNNQYMHKFGLATDGTNEALSYAPASDTYATLKEDITATESIWFGLQIHVPNNGTRTVQSAPVYVQASWSDAPTP